MSSKDAKDKSALDRLNEVRVELARKGLHKTGRNEFAKYSYFELGDFLPVAMEMMAERNLFGAVTFTPDASLSIFDTTTNPATIVFNTSISMADAHADLKGCHKIQNLGAVQTYLRRYLWVTALEICEADQLDRSEPLRPASGTQGRPASPPSRPASASKPQGAAPRQAGTSEAGKSGYMEAFAATMDALHGLEPKPWDTQEMAAAVASDKKGRPANKIWFGKVWLSTAKAAKREPWEFENWTADDWADQNARLHELVGKIIDGAGTEAPRYSDALDFEQ